MTLRIQIALRKSLGAHGRSAGMTFAQIRAFTAIEITAVATIMAILALILIPIVRSRVDAARVTAALVDLKTFELAEVLAKADTGHYFRLADLDNARIEGNDDTIPFFYWNRPIPVVQRNLLVRTWAGPYMSFNEGKFDLVANLNNDFPALFRLISSNVDPLTGPPVIPATTSGGEGPIPILFASGRANDFGRLDTHPVDPWGGPYIFFAPERVGDNGGRTAISTSGNETDFGIAAVYSLGRDGLPGPGADGDDPLNYFRETGALGTGDDLVRFF